MKMMLSYVKINETSRQHKLVCLIFLNRCRNDVGVCTFTTYRDLEESKIDIREIFPGNNVIRLYGEEGDKLYRAVGESPSPCATVKLRCYKKKLEDFNS